MDDAPSVLDDAKQQLAEAMPVLGQPEVHAMLPPPRREASVSIPLRRDDGPIEVLRSYCVQHNNSRGPSKDGVRFDAGVDLDEVRALAMWMTWKCALLDVPTEEPKGKCAPIPRLQPGRAPANHPPLHLRDRSTDRPPPRHPCA